MGFSERSETPTESPAHPGDSFQGHQPPRALKQELLDTVRRELGPVAVVGELNFVNMLPQTRSGKIMRRVLKAVTLDRDRGDVTTIEAGLGFEQRRPEFTSCLLEQYWTANPQCSPPLFLSWRIRLFYSAAIP